MKDLANIYPDYSFEKHKGYGTKAHIEAIKDKGAIEGVHRKVFLRIIFIYYTSVKIVVNFPILNK